jgi:hypothetical protein
LNIQRHQPFDRHVPGDFGVSNGVVSFRIFEGVM